jgi:hypothetical protein
MPRRKKTWTIALAGAFITAIACTFIAATIITVCHDSFFAPIGEIAIFILALSILLGAPAAVLFSKYRNFFFK